MIIESELKPLYANLKRLKIGDYLYSKDFDLYILEKDLDGIWKSCKQEVSKNRRVIMLGHHDTEDEEEAFIYFLSAWHRQRDDVAIFVTNVLKKFAAWSPIKINIDSIVENLIQLKFPSDEIFNFKETINSIIDTKPEKLEVKKISQRNNQNGATESNKIFIVHGRDDAARLELCKLIKDDLHLEPVVLQDQPNESIETIISKFERLARECSAAVVLFTPDDVGETNPRARQNVILELGYFLGRFSHSPERKIIMIKKGEIEIPSDISGVLYLEYTKKLTEIFYDLKKQFQHWGYKVN